MILTIDSQQVSLSPRAAAMVAFIVEQRGEIERHKSGEVILSFAPWQVAFSLRVKRGLKKLDEIPTALGSGSI